MISIFAFKSVCVLVNLCISTLKSTIGLLIRYINYSMLGHIFMQMFNTYRSKSELRKIWKSVMCVRKLLDFSAWLFKPSSMILSPIFFTDLAHDMHLVTGQSSNLFHCFTWTTKKHVLVYISCLYRMIVLNLVYAWNFRFALESNRLFICFGYAVYCLVYSVTDLFISCNKSYWCYGNWIVMRNKLSHIKCFKWSKNNNNINKTIHLRFKLYFIIFSDVLIWKNVAVKHSVMSIELWINKLLIFFQRMIF